MGVKQSESYGDRHVRIDGIQHLPHRPTDQGESVSDHVSEVIRMIKESGVDYRLTPMGTVIETEQLAEALANVEKAATILQQRDCRRIYFAPAVTLAGA